MKKICLFLLFLTTFSVAVFAQSKEEQAIIQLDRQRFDAQIGKDTTALNLLLANDLIYTHSSALIENKQEFVKKIGNKQWDYREVNIEKVQARIYHKNTAVINGTAKINLWQTDKMMTIYLTYTDIWVKQKGKWQMVSWQSTRIN
ncbi:MAG: nuclear transport factor 2 family protein [Cytophagales bacterium]|nr:MAG: nuclear transport factor 2 family protein [Cytophagales bacterium]